MRGSLATNRQLLLYAVVMVLLGLVLIGVTIVNYRFSQQSPGGNDFIPRWLGTRLYIYEGISPYSETTTQAIQEFIYSRQANTSEDQVLFVYPYYSMLVFAPFALVGDYELARAMWMTTLEISIVATAVISISLAYWKLPKWLLGLLLLFSLTWYHSVRPMVNGNASILVALFIVIGLMSIRSENDFLAGFMLSLSTIKPQMVVLLIPFVLLWALSHRRWPLVWGFVGSMALLFTASFLQQPDWLLENLRQVLAYPDYTQPGTPAAIFSEWMPGVGQRLGWLLSGILAVILVYEWTRSWSKDYHHFLWTVFLTLTLTNMVGIRTTTANYIALLPGLILVFALWDQRWNGIGRGAVVVSVLILLVGLWWLFINTIEISDQPWQHPVMFFPLPLFLIIGLYWVRWWAIRPPRLLMDQIQTIDHQTKN